MSPEKKRLAWHLLLNTVILTVLYFVLQRANIPVHYVYVGAGAVLGLFYVIYNRGFVGKNATPEMLPDTMTPEEKQSFIRESRERMQRTQWVLTLLIPVTVAVLLDFVYLFFFPYVEALLA
ncbi:MAG: hypothetical protein IJX62_07505 [Clostridia bacterium]|nr:hypothetical protein [Clostridia bacterium]